HPRSKRDWSSDVCSSDLVDAPALRDSEPLAKLLAQPLAGLEGQGDGVPLLPPGDQLVPGLLELRLDVGPDGGEVDVSHERVRREIGRASCRGRGWNGRDG